MYDAMMPVSSDTTEQLTGRLPTDSAVCHSSTPDNSPTCLSFSHVLPILPHYLLIYKSITPCRKLVAWNHRNKVNRGRASRLKRSKEHLVKCITGSVKQDTFHCYKYNKDKCFNCKQIYLANESISSSDLYLYENKFRLRQNHIGLSMRLLMALANSLLTPQGPVEVLIRLVLIVTTKKKNIEFASEQKAKAQVPISSSWRSWHRS